MESIDATSALLFVMVTLAVKMLLLGKKAREVMPGPRPWPLIGNAHLLAGNTSRVIPKICKLLDEYDGRIGLRIGSKYIVFMSRPEDLQMVLSHPKLQYKSDHYDYIKPLLGESLLTGNGERLKEAKKLLLPTMRPNTVKNLLRRFEKYAETLVTVIGQEAGGREFNSFSYLRNCTYDIIYEFVHGREINAQENHLEVLDTTEEIMDLIYQRAMNFWQQWDPLYYILPQGKKYLRGVRCCNEFNTKHMRETLKRSKEGKNQESLVQYLYEELGEDNFDLIREHVVTIIVTGYDTTAGTMGFILMMLGMHPDVQERVFEDVRSAKEENQMTHEAYDGMDYLERVIKETLRLFPVGALIFREATDDVIIGDLNIPKGTVVSPAMVHTHRNPEIFSNPLKFDPDNFLPDRVAARHPFSYIPFSAGYRTCFGTRYGMLSMKVIISHLVLNYRICCDTKIQNIRLKPEVTLKTLDGFNLDLLWEPAIAMMSKRHVKRVLR